MSKEARKKDATLPEKVQVRIFKATFRAPSGERITEWYVTSLRDAKRFKPAKLARLYHRRWQIETSYREFKIAFHGDVLRSSTVGNIEKEFLAHVLAYQLLRRLIVQAARKHHQQPTQISFIHAARWVLAFSDLMRLAPAVQLPGLYQCLLAAMASTPVSVRPGRLEPRALTRECKHYVYLRMARELWRKRRLAGLPERFRLS